MPVMVIMGVVEPEYSSVVTAVDGMVDVSRVVAGHDDFAFSPVPPDLVAQQSATGFQLKLKALFFEQDFWAS